MFMIPKTKADRIVNRLVKATGFTSSKKRKAISLTFEAILAKELANCSQDDAVHKDCIVYDTDS